MKKTILLFVLLIPFLVVAQGNSRLFFIRKVAFSGAQQQKMNNLFRPKLTGVMVNIYAMNSNTKADSLMIEGEDFRTWSDSVSFSISVPQVFLEKNSTFLINPVYSVIHKRKGVFENDRGDLYTTLTGDDASIKAIKLKIKSDPVGATVYLVPKFIWEKNPLLRNNDLSALGHYVVGNPTTANVSVQEYVYIVVYSFNNMFRNKECRPNHLNPVDSVFQKLN